MKCHTIRVLDDTTGKYTRITKKNMKELIKIETDKINAIFIHIKRKTY